MASLQNNKAGKRKRDGDATLSPGDGEKSSPPPPKSPPKRHKSPPPKPARSADAVAAAIEDLRAALRPAEACPACPRCGGAECKKNGRGKIRGGTVQKYCCKACHKNFHASAEASGTPPPTSLQPVVLDFEQRTKVQALFRRAHGEMAKREMAADEQEFERRMAELQGQLREKRRSISKLLGFPLEEDPKIADKTASVRGGGGGSSGGAAPRAKDPFAEIILLLREETPKLERAVDELLMRRRNHSPIADARVRVASFSDAQRRVMAEEEELSSTVDVVGDGLPGCASGCGAGYQLSSRITQEDGEEIEIFEKCTGDDD